MIITKIVHLTSVHNSTDTRIFHRECRTLAKSGYDVVLIAPADCDYINENVQVRAIHLPAARMKRMAVVATSLFGKAIGENGVIYHIHDPELIPVGLLLRLSGKTVIYDVHEYFSEVIPIRFPKYLRWLIRPVMHFFLESAPLTLFDHLIFPTAALRDEYADADHATVLYNYPSLADSLPSPLPAAEKTYDVVFVGTVSPFRLDIMLDIVRRLTTRRPAFRCLFLGISDASITWAKSNYDYEFLESHVVMKRRVPYEEVLVYLAASRIGYNYHPMEKRFEVAIPMKVYEYMLAGLPVVTSAFPELTKSLVGGKEVIFAASDDPEDHVRAIEYLLDNDIAAAELGAAGRCAVRERLNWEASEAPKLLSLYDRLLNQHPVVK